MIAAKTRIIKKIAVAGVVSGGMFGLPTEQHCNVILLPYAGRRGDTRDPKV
jgi:hypothetical protein